MRDGIRAQFPSQSPEQVEQTLRQRLQRIRQLHEHGLYRPLPE